MLHSPLPLHPPSADPSCSSISSSHLACAGRATLTYGVLDRPALSGNGRHFGVASSYLSTLRPGDRVQVGIRKAAGGFHLPFEPSKTPLICVAGGTGLAPFRAFIQERAIQKSNGKSLAPAILFYGCRDPDADDLYRDEFDAWEEEGVVQVFRAFSRKSDSSHGCKYVQNRMWTERKTIADLWSKDGRVYVCGSNKIAEGAKDVLVRIMRIEREKKGESMSDEEAAAWFEEHRNERFATDVFD